MTFSTNVPNAGQSPGVFPAQNNTNFTRLQTIISTDHVFNNTAAANDGFHNQVTLINRTDPSGVNPIIFSKLDGNGATQAAFYDGTSVRQLTGFPLILAAVNFDGTSSSPVIRSQFNVTSVTKSAGIFRVNFTNSLGVDTYIVLVTGRGPGTNGSCTGFVVNLGSYTSSVKATSIDVGFSTTGSTNVVSPDMCNVIVVKVA